MIWDEQLNYDLQNEHNNSSLYLMQTNLEKKMLKVDNSILEEYAIHVPFLSVHRMYVILLMLYGNIITT